MTENERLVAYLGLTLTNNVDAYIQSIANIWNVSIKEVGEILKETKKDFEDAGV